jgi:hypothetical protein
MKRLLASAGAASILSLGTLFVAAPAFADSGALVIKDFGCAMLDGNGGFALADSSHAVLTSNGNGEFRCRAEVTAAATGKAAHLDFASTGLSCSTLAGATTDWSEVVSASGQATLTCNVH